MFAMTRNGTKTHPSDKRVLVDLSEITDMDAQILVNENVNHDIGKRQFPSEESNIDRFFAFKQYEPGKLKQILLGGGLIFMVLLLTIIVGKILDIFQLRFTTQHHKTH